jgi:hypothetical protein
VVRRGSGSQRAVSRWQRAAETERRDQQDEALKSGTDQNKRDSRDPLQDRVPGLVQAVAEPDDVVSIVRRAAALLSHESWRDDGRVRTQTSRLTDHGPLYFVAGRRPPVEPTSIQLPL